MFYSEEQPLPSDAEIIVSEVPRGFDILIKELEKHWVHDKGRSNLHTTTFNALNKIHSRKPPYTEFELSSSFELVRLPTSAGNTLGTSYMINFSCGFSYPGSRSEIMRLEMTKLMITGFLERINYLIAFPSNRMIQSLTLSVGADDRSLNVTAYTQFAYNLEIMIFGLKPITENLSERREKLIINKLQDKDYAEAVGGYKFTEGKVNVLTQIAKMVNFLRLSYSRGQMPLEPGNMISVIGWSDDQRKTGYIYSLKIPGTPDEKYKFEIAFTPSLSGLNLKATLIAVDDETLMIEELKFGWYGTSKQITEWFDWGNMSKPNIEKLLGALMKFPYPKEKSDTKKLRKLTGRLK